MRCEECLPLLDEYICGELDEPLSNRLATHLAGCENCTSEQTELQREQNFYARCAVPATPALWAGVRIKIAEEEKAGGGFSLPGARLWLAGALNAWRLSPLRATAAAVVIVIALSVGLLNYIELGGDAPVDEAAVRPENESKEQPSLSVDIPVTSASDKYGVSVQTGGDIDVSVSSKKIEKRVDKFIAVAGEKDVKPKPRKTIIAARRHISNRDSSKAEVSRVSDRTGAAFASGIDTETAHHVERAQILLRSFKHWRFSEDEMALEIDYEKKLSRELLGKNILLRADAQSRGNEEAGKLLARLEPFLLDIANLQEGLYQEQVALIRERMHQEGIISSLRLF
ncbi:MAG TPA: hypothetical protein VIQ24_15650 [Pyrinomonadaceae bacterium]